ncbi:EAL domain-containing protein [Clostridium sp.]
MKFSTDTVKAEANQTLKYMAKSYANSLEIQFSEITKIVNVLQSDVLMNIDESKIHDDKYIEDLIKRIEPTVKSQAQNSSKGKTAYVYFNPELTGKVHDIYYADQNGNGKVERQNVVSMEYYTSKSNSSQNKSWWSIPVSTHKDYWSKPYKWELDNGKVEEFVSYTRPIYIGDKLLCVIGSDFTYENIKQNINGIKIYNSGYSFLLDSNYDIIIHPLYKNYENIGDINDGKFRQYMDKLKGNDLDVIAYTSADNSKKVSALTRMSNGWIIGIVADQHEILSSMISLKKIMYFLIASLSILSLILALRLGNKITKPIILISNIVKNIGNPDYSVKIPAEYLQRKDELGTLSASIKTMSEKITENIEEINHQNHILKYDTLTNCINKDYFKQLVNKYIKDTKQNMSNAAMMIINIDNFRVINETMGYESGNMLLLEIAQRLFSNSINFSLLARTDGDEFTLFVEKVGDQEDIIHKIDLIFSLFNTPFKVYHDEIFVSISAGISLYPADGSYHEELFKNASSAINHVKLQKKNGYEFYQEQFNKMSTEKYEIINNLRSALSRNEFELYYQPQVDIQKNKLIGVEALLRWNSPSGRIPPFKFIPFAEETGIIIPIGEWVLKEACKMGVKLMNLGYPMIVGVNISVIQFKEGYLVELIDSILKETGLPSKALDIEITESILMDNSSAMSRIFKELKEMGVSLSIDDFGTGYSSLAYLKNYIVDRLKIDRSFIKDIPHDDDGTIAKTIINLTKSLGIKSIAEGIEEKEQLDFLIENGCDEIQGYYYSKPVPADKLLAYIREFERNR